MNYHSRSMGPVSATKNLHLRSEENILLNCFKGRLDFVCILEIDFENVHPVCSRITSAFGSPS